MELKLNRIQVWVIKPNQAKKVIVYRLTLEIFIPVILEVPTKPQLTLVRSTTNMSNWLKAPKQFNQIEKLQAKLKLKLEKLIDQELLKLQKRKLKKQAYGKFLRVHKVFLRS